MNTEYGGGDLHKSLPPDYRPTEKELEMAYYMFGKRNGIDQDIRFLIGSWNHETGKAVIDKTWPELRIILNNRLCLFFYGHSGQWVFDDYECGNYEGIWTEFEFLPEKRERIIPQGDDLCNMNGK